jgi:hypothetical protein
MHSNNHYLFTARPRKVEDIQETVRRFAHVQAVGEGHSWNGPFFCPAARPAKKSTSYTCDLSMLSPENSSADASGSCSGTATADPLNASAGIVLGTIRPLQILVDEAAMAVDVDAVVRVWDLIDYLGNYVTHKSPTGYTLGAIPWFVFQVGLSSEFSLLADRGTHKSESRCSKSNVL